jgi:hypothetical protein
MEGHIDTELQVMNLNRTKYLIMSQLRLSLVSYGCTTFSQLRLYSSNHFYFVRRELVLESQNHCSIISVCLGALTFQNRFVVRCFSLCMASEARHEGKAGESAQIAAALTLTMVKPAVSRGAGLQDVPLGRAGHRILKKWRYYIKFYLNKNS